MNRILSIDSNLDGVSSFTYDKRSQLLTANHAASRPDENYSFDSNGNRTNAGYSAGGNNQTVSDGVYNYTFDQEGNRSRRTRISDGSYEDYTWDHRNRLTRVTFKNSVGTTLRVVDYTNDVFNRLVQRVYDSNGPATGGVTTTYLVGYDGINPTLAFDGPNASDLTNRYLWGPAVDQLLADEQIANPTVDGNTIWALGDHLGTIRDLADFNSGTSNYTIVNHRVYDSFGRLTSETNGTINESFAYTGKYFDEVTGLSNHWHRWYDPQLGKWISGDPIGFAAGDANLTRYVGNSSNDFADPLGLVASRSDDEWRLDLYDHKHDGQHDTRGAHIQKGDWRWDARTLRPLKTGNELAPGLTRGQIKEIYKKGIFDEILSKLPDNKIQDVIRNELGQEILDELKKKGARFTSKRTAREVIRVIAKKSPLALLLVAASAPEIKALAEERGVPFAVANELFAAEAIENIVTPIVEREIEEGHRFFNNSNVAIRVRTLVNAGFSENEARKTVSSEFGFNYQTDDIDE